MNLENREKRTPGFGEDYREGDFEETAAADQPPVETRDDKMHLILNELSQLKSNVTATREAPAAPAAQNYGGDPVMAELARLREENIRAQNAQEISAQVTRMKDELVRELKAVPSQDAAVLAEIRRLADRVDALDRRDPRDSAALREPRPDYANAYPAGARAAADDRLSLKTVDDINSKLFHLDRQLSELSVMTLANDITPITKDLQSIRQLLEGRAAGRDAGADADTTDKILDELVRMQAAFEEMKRSLEELTQAEPFDESEPVVQETLFAAKQRDQLEELGEALDAGLQSLNEQIAELHADIKIYAEEGAFAPVQARESATAVSPAAAGASDERRLETLSAQLDDIKLQLATNLQYVAHASPSENAEEGSGYDKIVLDALAEVRYRLDRLETPAAAASGERWDEIIRELSELRAQAAAADPAPLAAALAELAAGQPDLAPVLARLDELAARPDPDLVPLVNTVAEMQSEANVDLTPVLDAIAGLPARDAAPVVEALSDVKAALERIAEKAGASDGEAAAALAEQLRAEMRAKTDDHSDVLQALSALRGEVAALSAAPPAESPSAVASALREEFGRVAVYDDTRILQEIAALRRDLVASAAAQKELDEIRRQREALWEDKMRVMLREELSRALAAGAASAALVAAAPVTPPSAPVAAAPAVADRTRREKTAAGSDVVTERPARKPDRAAPARIKNPARPARPATAIELSPADAIANQIAQKIALQQLLAAGADKIGKGRAKRILARVRAEQAKEPTFEASEDSIRRNANRLVLGRLLEDAREDS